jgi:6-methylsalicylate decarboxylase
VTTYDVHRHVWPDALTEALRGRTSPPRLSGTILEIPQEGAYEIDPSAYSVEACLADLERTGVDVAVISCPPTLGIGLLPPEEAQPLLDAYHEGAFEAMGRSGGRLLALSLGRPLDGFVGTTIAADDLDDLDLLAPVLDEIVRRETFAFIHPGISFPPRNAPVWWVAGVAYTSQMQRAYARWLAHGIPRWPTLKIVFAILAGGVPVQIERLQARGFDVSAALHPTIYLETASYGRRALDHCMSMFGATHIIFGSDAPVVPTERGLADIRSFGQAAADALSSENPERLLTT